MKKQKLILISCLVSSLSATSINDFLNIEKCDQVIDKQLYSICYSYKYKGALAGWVSLNKKVNQTNIKKRPRFYSEKNIPMKYRTKYKDYTGTGKQWNRGHFIVADADFDYSKKSLNKAYTMANIQPQSAKVNQKTWTKVEKYGRKLATKFNHVNSISIADYSNTKGKLKNNITIPGGFYRIYYNDNENFKKCFYYKNNLNVNYKKDKLKNHEIKCDTIKITY
jgi:endonuclease G, mitochondrial